MLQSLSIQNYALISSLDISLDRGFTVITGETGAGKSILLGAIALLLGQRAETRMIKDGANRCIIEAEFNLEGYDLQTFFEQHDFDFDGRSCIIRRELTATGKSRAFINDTPAAVADLRELGERLIDIHSQHQNLLLAQEDFQMSILDIIGNDSRERSRYDELFTHYQEATQALREAEQSLANGREDEDYLRFQLTQIDELQLESGKQAAIEQEARMLEHAEEIREALWTTSSLLNGDGSSSEGILAMLREAVHRVGNLRELLPESAALAERIDSCKIELDDISRELQNYAERTDVDPARLAAVNEWLSSLYAIQHKHHVNTDDELIALANEFRSRLDAIDNSDEHISRLRQQQQQALEALLEAGKELTARRTKAARQVERQMHERLVPLGIPNVQFHVDLQPRPQPVASGCDQVDFLFCANKNGQLQPISKVASGGEIARVMLSLKAMISGAVHLPTIIFDEIDTGVSGHIAESMAQIMAEMGRNGRQVISISHLPQIAAMADHHFRVYKQDDELGTHTHIQPLTDDERVTEIAHMLSGSRLSNEAIENARVLLRTAHQDSPKV